MKRYTVSIEVSKIYHVDVDAESGADAIDIADKMQSTKIEDEGELENVETNALEVENEEDIDENE